MKDSLCWRVSPGKWPDSPLGGYSVSRSRRSVAHLFVIVPGLRPSWNEAQKLCAVCARSFGITCACLPCSAFHPCKVSPRLRLHRATVHPASIQFQLTTIQITTVIPL